MKSGKSPRSLSHRTRTPIRLPWSRRLAFPPCPFRLQYSVPKHPTRIRYLCGTGRNAIGVEEQLISGDPILGPSKDRTITFWESSRLMISVDVHSHMSKDFGI